MIACQHRAPLCLMPYQCICPPIIGASSCWLNYSFAPCYHFYQLTCMHFTCPLVTWASFVVVCPSVLGLSLFALHLLFCRLTETPIHARATPHSCIFVIIGCAYLSATATAPPLDRVLQQYRSVVLVYFVDSTSLLSFLWFPSVIALCSESLVVVFCLSSHLCS